MAHYEPASLCQRTQTNKEEEEEAAAETTTQVFAAYSSTQFLLKQTDRLPLEFLMSDERCKMTVCVS